VAVKRPNSFSAKGVRERFDHLLGLGEKHFSHPEIHRLRLLFFLTEIA
jgi:hypothetical protein